MNRKITKILKIVFLVLFLIGILFLHFYVPRIITEIRNPLITYLRPHPEMKIRYEDEILHGEYINFKSFDGTELSSYITYTDSAHVHGTIILVHGIRSQKEHFIELSKKLAVKGYNSVAVDLRAHGQSGGQHCTFGVKEKKDISALIDTLLEKDSTQIQIGIWGQSLGGAVALQALGSDSRIKYGIVESSFTNFRTITNDYFAYHLGFSFRPLTNYLVNRAGKIADFDPDDANPNKYCKNITQRTLIVHGYLDKRIDIQYGIDNYNQIKSKGTKFLGIDYANHLDVWDVGGDDYFEQAFSFLPRLFNFKKYYQTFLNLVNKEIVTDPKEKRYICDIDSLYRVKMVSIDSTMIHYSDSINGNKIDLIFKNRNFRESQHKIKCFTEFDWVKSVDGHKPWGCIYGYLGTDVKSIEIKINGKEIRIPNYHDIFNIEIEEKSYHENFTPNPTLFYDHKNDVFYLYIWGGNNADTYFGKYVFDKNGYINRYLLHYGQLSETGSFAPWFKGF